MCANETGGTPAARTHIARVHPRSDDPRLRRDDARHLRAHASREDRLPAGACADHRRARRRGSGTASIGCSAKAASVRSISPRASADRRSVPDVVCIKVSERIDGWLREAYFGQLLDGASARDPRLRRLSADAPGRLASSTASRSSTRGTATSARFSAAAGKEWPESAARREIAGILEVLGKLHRGQMLHRDLTPMNVFVCDEPGA